MASFLEMPKINPIFDAFLWQVNIKLLETIFIRRAPRNGCPWERLLHKLWPVCCDYRCGRSIPLCCADFVVLSSLCESVHRFPSDPKIFGSRSVLRTRTACYSSVAV